MLDLSIAFGWVAKNMAKRGKPHRHNKTSEFLFVVDGSGYIETDQGDRPIVSGDWIRIQPKEKHGLRNEKPENLIVVCVCSPAFQMDDVS